MLRLIASLVVLCSLGSAQPAPAPGRTTAGGDDKLPIRRVVLYKNGVGYFEHVGPVTGNQDVSISFTSGQLNDVLKSLTVLDLNGGQITAVGYGSNAPVDRQLADLRLPINESTSLLGFLQAIKGARVEVKSGSNTITGRLLSVERKQQTSGGTSISVDYVSLLTENGELKTTDLSPSFSLRLLERGLPGKVDHYLDLASASRDADVRRMVLYTEGSGDRSVFLSYISEVPVWKATYRVVLNPKSGQAPLLQGWAIVDNTVGQDWENVQLSLVAGAPQSFIQNLSQPFYTRRPVVPLTGSFLGKPQTFEATLIPGATELAGVVTDPAGAVVGNASVKAYDGFGKFLAQTLTNAQGGYSFSGLPEGSVRIDVQSPGFKASSVRGVAVLSGQRTQQDVALEVGQVSESVTVTARAATLNTESAEISGRSSRNLGSGSNLGGNRNSKSSPFSAPPPPVYTASDVEAARSTLQTAALAQDLGDLFEYKLKEPITIERNHSALVPIVQAPIGAEKVSVWNDRSGSPRPLRALWLTNSTTNTLDGGSFSVLEDETFAGEGIFDSIRPGEKRLVSYAVDLAANASSQNSSERQRVTRVRIANGVLIQQSELREKKTYTFRNEDSAGRTIIVEHPVRPEYRLRGDLKPAETTAAWYRFRLAAEPKQTVALTVEEAKPLESKYAVSGVTGDLLAFFVKEKSISSSIEAALRKIVQQQSEIADLEAQKSRRDDESDQIFDDQQRLRENLKALKGSAEERALVQRYTSQLNEQETRLDALRKEIQEFERRIDQAKLGLDNSIQSLSFDEVI